MKNIQVYKADRRAYAEMIVEKYNGTRYSYKFFLAGFIIGIVPYIVHMKF
jgi:hypothetical protein